MPAIERKLFRYAILFLGFAILSGCAADRVGLTNSQHPGPAIGQAVGSTVGAIGGNAVAGVVGFGEGIAIGAAAPFDNTKRVVRHWRTEVTADGRNIQVPENYIVDNLGRPVTGKSSKNDVRRGVR
ncbi:MAG: flagellar motor protein MotB [Verrucomicrobia bacterium]|nr:flagellar motor protein MotB [Verrucomicrobiota bacterium]